MLELEPEQRSELHRSCLEAWPHEACGLMQGLWSGSAWRVSRIVATRNVASENPRERFQIDPGEFLRAALAARDAGEDLVGTFHSHPGSPAVPSEVDRHEAPSGWAHLIVSVEDGAVCAERAWRWTEPGGDVVELPLSFPRSAARAGASP